MTSIAIIGGGPTGMMVAAELLLQYEQLNRERSIDIHLYEKNASLGKKLSLSGGGRCNITTSIIKEKDLKAHYTRGWNDIKYAMKLFGPKDCYRWFEGNGLPLKTQDDKRVFPKSDNSKDVIETFEKIFNHYTNILTLHYTSKILDISPAIHADTSQFAIRTDTTEKNFDIVVIATGGNAYRNTGSEGDGYSFAKNFGHTITSLGPSLSSFKIQQHWILSCQGLVLEQCALVSEKHSYKVEGSLLITHFGISGPLTFKMSSLLAFDTITDTMLKIIPIASMGEHEWNTFLLESFTRYPKKTLKNILKLKLSEKFSEAFISSIQEINSYKNVSEIPSDIRKEIASILGNGIPVVITERRPGDEFVTAGGIVMEELHTKNFESKLYSNLYFGGEILNVDGFTGGFSLQICWSSAIAIARDIIQKL